MALSGSFATNTVYSYWGPRVTGLGEMGEYGSLWADGLFPLQDMSNQVSFIDLQAQGNRFYSDPNYAGIFSPGAGIRHAFSNDNVLGLYLFSDYMMTNVNQNFWLLSPGMDFYRGPNYASFNAYVSINNTPRQAGTPVTASSTGIDQYVSFAGNSAYDHLIQNFYTMRWGMDLTGGRLFGDKNEWGIKVGGYLYDAQYVNSITGARGGIDYYINDRVVLTFEQRYDNVFYSQSIIGIKVSFMGKDNRGTVETQLKAPIYRNLNINTTNVGTPVGQYQQVSSQSYLIQDHITFVSNAPRLTSGTLLQAGAISGDGTYENPYTGLDQTILNNPTTLLNNHIWVEGTGANNPYSDASILTLQTGESIYGRTDGFRMAASNVSDQPIFNFAPGTGIAALYINNSNILENFVMYRNGGVDDSIGVQVANTGLGTASINGVTIGSSIIDNGFAKALYNQGQLSVTGSTLYATKDTYTVSGSSPAQGVFGLYNDGGHISINHTNISANINHLVYPSSSMGGGILAGSWGIYNTSSGVASVDQSQINAQAQEVNYDAGSSILGGDFSGAFGVANNTGTLTLSNSTVNVTAESVIDTRIPGGSAASSVIGAFGLYNTNGTMTVLGGTSTIKALANNVDNQGVSSFQGLLDYVGAFGALNNGGNIGSTSTLDIKQAQVTSLANTVTASLFNPAVTSMGVWNYANNGTANTTVEQGAKIDVNASWRLGGAVSLGSAVNAFGIYNQGYLGNANLVADSATINITESGGDGSGSGIIAGVINGSLNGGSSSSAVSIIKGATSIKASGSANGVSVYGFMNNSNNDSTAGTTIEGGSIIDSEGGTTGVSAAIYNTTLGNLIIQGTADNNVILIANGAIGSGSNYGLYSYYQSQASVDYVTIRVGPAQGASGGESIGIYNSSNSTVSLQNSTVTVFSPNTATNVYGVLNDSYGGVSTTNISHSTFNVTTNGGSAYGINNDSNGASESNVSDSTFNVSSSDIGNVYGVYNNGGSTASILRSLFNVSATNAGTAYGIYNINSSTANITNSTFNVTSESGDAYGSYNDSTSTININDSIFNVTSSGSGHAYGFWDLGGGTNFLSQTILNLFYDNLTGSGTAFNSLGTYTGQSNVQCRYNGVLSTCN